MKKVTILVFGFTLFIYAECIEVVVLHPASYIAQQYGRSVNWVYASGKKINIWENSSEYKKGKKVGELRIGSHAKILIKKENDYKIVSPYDKNIGWINKIQIERTQYQDSKTHEKCIP